MYPIPFLLLMNIPSTLSTQWGLLCQLEEVRPWLENKRKAALWTSVATMMIRVWTFVNRWFHWTTKLWAFASLLVYILSHLNVVLYSGKVTCSAPYKVIFGGCGSCNKLNQFCESTGQGPLGTRAAAAYPISNFLWWRSPDSGRGLLLCCIVS